MLEEICQIFGLQLKSLGQVLLAMLLGAFIGFNREVYQKPAGLRTHILVAGASALIVILAQISVIKFNEFG